MSAATSPEPGLPELTPELIRSLSDCTCQHMRKTARAITRFYDRHLAASGLKSTQFAVLAALAGFPGSSVTELSDRLGLDHSTLVRNLRPLTLSGFVTSTEGKDRRERRLKLSATGRDTLRASIPLWQDAQDAILERLDGGWPEARQSLKSARQATRDA